MLIVGLGNFGKNYENTYHNVGFSVVENLTKRLGIKIENKGCKALYADCYINGERTIIAQPQTYMNLSGESVIDLKGHFNFSNEDIVIIYDDIDLPVGRVRVRKDGSGGTHNGMKNIIMNLGTGNISRIRVGIGKPENERMELKDYVLSKISGEKKETIEKVFDVVAETLEAFLQDKDIDKLMRVLNAVNV